MNIRAKRALHASAFMALAVLLCGLLAPANSGALFGPQERAVRTVPALPTEHATPSFQLVGIEPRARASSRWSAPLLTDADSSSPWSSGPDCGRVDELADAAAPTRPRRLVFR